MVYIRELSDYLNPLLSHKHDFGKLRLSEIADEVAACTRSSTATIQIHIQRYRRGSPVSYTGNSPHQKTVEDASKELPLVLHAVAQRSKSEPPKELLDELEHYFSYTHMGQYPFKYPPTEEQRTPQARKRAIHNMDGDGI